MIINTASVGTVITGDIGVSPGTAVTGFPPGIVTGTIHAGDATAFQAQADLAIAFNNAAGRSTAPNIVVGNLGGMTLYPGLYKSTRSLEISSGDLILDASGNPNAVFIFQITSWLEVTPGCKVILKGNAQSSNIFWQVGSTATFGTDSAFKGTIMAYASIIFKTGATLDGRALARIGAVALDSNTIVTNPNEVTPVPTATATPTATPMATATTTPKAIATATATATNIPSPTPVLFDIPKDTIVVTDDIQSREDLLGSFDADSQDNRALAIRWNFHHEPAFSGFHIYIIKDNGQPEFLDAAFAGSTYYVWKNPEFGHSYKIRLWGVLANGGLLLDTAKSVLYISSNDPTPTCTATPAFTSTPIYTSTPKPIPTTAFTPTSSPSPTISPEGRVWNYIDLGNLLKLPMEGFLSADLQTASIPTDNAFANATDGLGLKAVLQPGQGALLLSSSPVSSGNGLIELKVSVRTTSNLIQLGLAGIAVSDYGAPDGSLGYVNPTGNEVPVNKWGEMDLIYDCPVGNYYPAIQFVLPKEAASAQTVYFDNLRYSDYFSGIGKPIKMAFDTTFDTINSTLDTLNPYIFLDPSFNMGQIALMSGHSDQGVVFTLLPNITNQVSRIGGFFAEPPLTPLMVESSLYVKKESADDNGMFALVILDGEQTIAYYVKASHLPLNQFKQIRIGGNFSDPQQLVGPVVVIQYANMNNKYGRIVIDDLNVTKQ